MEYLAGIDIGGTKCSVSLGRAQEGQVELLCREKFPTPGTPREAVERMKDSLGRLLSSAPQNGLSAVGVSCGGPLSSERGLILSPPNLPGWDGIDILTPFEKAFGVPAFLENDANACALAEWLWGAGKGTRNMVFLTFGTGLGAGLILDGHLYRGACDMAGEAGHIRRWALERPAPLRDSAAEAESAEWDGPWQKKEDWRRRESFFPLQQESQRLRIRGMSWLWKYLEGRAGCWDLGFPCWWTF